MRQLLCAVLVLGIGATVASAQEPQFELQRGSVQIGSAPGRVNMAHPTLRMVTPGTRVQFSLTVSAPEGAGPCSGRQQCLAAVGLRSHDEADAPITDVWSAFTLPTGISGPMVLDLPTTAPARALPKGNRDLVVRITRGAALVFEYLVPVVVP